MSNPKGVSKKNFDLDDPIFRLGVSIRHAQMQFRKSLESSPRDKEVRYGKAAQYAELSHRAQDILKREILHIESFQEGGDYGWMSRCFRHYYDDI